MFLFLEKKYPVAAFLGYKKIFDKSDAYFKKKKKLRTLIQPKNSDHSKLEK
jgi:hypothetical protein